MDARTTALVIIDMQNDFVEKGAVFEVSGILDGLGNMKKFIDVCRKLGVSIIYTRHSYAPQGNPMEIKVLPGYRKGALLEGTHGWEISKIIAPLEDDLVIDKTKYDAFFRTDLDSALKAKNIHALVIAGTMTNVCCKSTARSAMSLDYEVIFCSDLTFTSNKKAHESTLRTIKRHFGKVLDSESILSGLG